MIQYSFSAPSHPLLSQNNKKAATVATDSDNSCRIHFDMSTHEPHKVSASSRCVNRIYLWTSFLSLAMIERERHWSCRNVTANSDKARSVSKDLVPRYTSTLHVCVDVSDLM
jgi:hypothetical protein